jgi:hypothetical protein
VVSWKLAHLSGAKARVRIPADPQVLIFLIEELGGECEDRRTPQATPVCAAVLLQGTG